MSLAPAVVKQKRLLEIGSDETWTPFHDKINDLMVIEKKARQENDALETARLCKEIVSLKTTYYSKN